MLHPLSSRSKKIQLMLKTWTLMNILWSSQESDIFIKILFLGLFLWLPCVYVNIQNTKQNKVVIYIESHLCIRSITISYYVYYAVIRSVRNHLAQMEFRIILFLWTLHYLDQLWKLLVQHNQRRNIFHSTRNDKWIKWKKNENEIQSSSVANYKQIPNWNVT